MQPLAYRSIWISDVHLGARDAKSEFLLDFLRHTESEHLYLVGDIIDCWKICSGWHWPPINNELVRLVMKKARQRTRVIYVPGNHDELLRDYPDIHLGDSRYSSRPCTAPPTAAGSSSCTATSSTPWS
jgi:UDP-2,3-diacylglucosamine pyrophosphatase LpxH